MSQPKDELLSAVTTADTVLLVGGSSITAARRRRATAAGAATAPAADGYVTPQDQSLNQEANTGQGAFSKAVARQHGLNDSSPVKEEKGKNPSTSGRSCGASRNGTGCTGTQRLLRVGLRAQGNSGLVT